MHSLKLYFCLPHKDGRTLLHHAAEYGHADVVELLLNGKRRVNTNCKDFVHKISFNCKDLFFVYSSAQDQFI